MQRTLALGSLFDKVHTAQTQPTLGGSCVQPCHKSVRDVVMHPLGRGLYGDVVPSPAGLVWRDGLVGWGSNQRGHGGMLLAWREGAAVRVRGAGGVLEGPFQFQHCTELVVIIKTFVHHHCIAMMVMIMRSSNTLIFPFLDMV
jgi:hypothetical protein